MLIAVIVTYNRLEKLKKSINTLMNGQLVPDKVVIVNNFSNDGTREWLQQTGFCQNFEVINSDKNLGGAGGFEIGILTAYNLGANYIWISDDDAVVNEHSLSELMNASIALYNNGIQFGFLCSKVVWIDGDCCYLNQPVVSDDWLSGVKYADNLIKVSSCSFVSCLISRSAISDLGLPIADFFIWYDDTEYTTRISEKYANFLVLNSVVVHECADNPKFSLANINSTNSWKYYYGARNSSWTTWRDYGTLGWSLFLFRKLREIKRDKVSIKYAIKLVFAYFKGIFFKPRIKSLKNIKL